jgi:hypothetical protein
MVGIQMAVDFQQISGTVSSADTYPQGWITVKTTTEEA